jgi:subtilisin family serine protease
MRIAPMRVLVQLRPAATHPPAAAAGERRTEAAGARLASLGTESMGGLPTAFSLDATYDPVAVPTPVAEEPGADRFSLTAPRRFLTEPDAATDVVRGSVPDGVGQQSALAELSAHPDVVGVFADPVIESSLVCPGDAPVGAAKDVAAALGVAALQRKGLDGTGVTVAVVDSGVNVAHLQSKGQQPKLNANKSWSPKGVPTKPGKHPVDHGTMCAFDVGIGAPKATVLDYALLLSSRQGKTAMSGLLSDAIAAYSTLLQLVSGMPANRRALVVNNSWGMFSPNWDFPVRHPGNYSDNPTHPFNVIVASLEAAGADILFAAGNCGRDCPDGRCEFRARPICGANSHPAVISVAGVDVKRRRVGYSSQGPGRLAAEKPDLAAYTHFKGSGVYPADGGTSAACPVLAGLVAAVRSKYPATKVKPAQLRRLLCKTASDLGKGGYDYDHGWGLPDSAALVKALEAL